MNIAYWHVHASRCSVRRSSLSKIRVPHLNTAAAYGYWYGFVLKQERAVCLYIINGTETLRISKHSFSVLSYRSTGERQHASTTNASYSVDVCISTGDAVDHDASKNVCSLTATLVYVAFKCSAIIWYLFCPPTRSATSPCRRRNSVGWHASACLTHICFAYASYV